MQTIILTGSTGGLGSVLAERIMEQGLGDLICVYRNEAKFQKMFAEKSGAMYSYRTSEKDDFTGLEQMLAAMAAEEVVLILNAFSIVPIKRVGTYTQSEIEEMVGGNVRQNVVLLNAVLRFCGGTGRKLRIVNLDSGAADFPLQGWGSYCASKAYLNAFLSVIALENPEHRVVSFDPGVMDTGMQAQIRQTDKRVFDQVNQFIAYRDDQKLAAPEAVADELIERYISRWTATALREERRS